MTDDRIIVEGGHPLYGEVTIHGAKNAVLPILSASLLLPETRLHNCPVLTDVTAACRILTHLGCSVRTEDETLLVQTENANGTGIPQLLAGEMRGSIIFLGALLARFGRADIALPGGCKLGPRPIDMHLSGLRQMGACIEETENGLCCFVPDRLKSADISLRYPSVGATENLLIAAVYANGETILRGAAMEPEIDSLIEFLTLAGAKIRRIGTIISVQGVQKLHAVEYRVIPDRIETATYLAAAAAVGGKICLRKTQPQTLASVFPVLEEMGCHIRRNRDEIILVAPKALRPVHFLSTGPYPTFPTDALPPMMIPPLLAKGESCFEESVFSGRYLHIEQLIGMGADICVNGSKATVRGVPALHGKELSCTDLRGGAALLIAALAAEGISTLEEMRHIYRGYSELTENLTRLGARICIPARERSRNPAV